MRVPSPVDPRVNYRSVAREVEERCFLRDAFEYQHCERVGVGTRRCGDAVVLDELGGRVSDNVSRHRPRERERGFGDVLHDLRDSEVANLGFALPVYGQPVARLI